MLAASSHDLPTEPGYVYEPKWDGFRCLAGVNSRGKATLWSRRGTDLTVAFPEVATALARALPADTVVDGEIVRWDGAHLNFEALQRRNRTNAAGAARLAQTEPCHVIVFDLLRRAGQDLATKPLSQRRAALEELLDRMEVRGPHTVMLGMQTDDVDTARLWSESMAPLGVEGVVAKRASQTYRPGVRGWQKIKRHESTEAIVGGVTGTLDRPESLVLGRIHRSDGQLHVAGRTTDLSPDAADRIAERIRPAGEEHPWPAQLPPSWHETAPRDYGRVVPDVIVEIRVDVATGHSDDGPGRWRHKLRFLRLRDDLSVSDVPQDLDLSAQE